MIGLFFLLLQAGEVHYLDGVSFTLLDGTLVKTAEKVSEDRLGYTWREEGVLVVLAKVRVKDVEYFSMKVPGVAPRKKQPTAAQRRLSGLPAAYQVEGRTYLKCRHIDGRGRSTEGFGSRNRVAEIRVTGINEVGRHSLQATFAKVTPASLITFRFYDLRGRLLFQSLLPMETASPVGGEPFRHHFSLPGHLDLKQIGLVEVVDTKLKDAVE